MKPANIYKCKESGTTLLQMNHNAVIFGDLEQLHANTSDGAAEKHVPVLEHTGNTLHVKVGSVPHPMLPEHYIEWILVQTDIGGLYRINTPDDLPEATFTLDKENIVAVYAYCNIHGLWKSDMLDSDLDLEKTVCSAEFSDSCIDV